MKTLLLSILLLVSVNSYADTRGIRTNNPLNINKTSIDWQGEVECEDTKNECFSTAYGGIRAGVRVLDNYYHRHGIRTVEGLVTRLSPRGPNSNEVVDSYIQFVTNRAGDASNGDDYRWYMTRVIKAMIHFENGSNPYDDKLIERAVENGTSARNYHYAWVCNTRGHYEDVVPVTAVQARAADGYVESKCTSQRAPPSTSGHQGQGRTMDTQGYSNQRGDGGIGVAKSCSTVWTSVVGRDVRLYADDSGMAVLSFLLRGHVDNSERASDNTFRHTRSKRNTWAIFWRFNRPKKLRRYYEM